MVFTWHTLPQNTRQIHFIEEYWCECIFAIWRSRRFQSFHLWTFKPLIVSIATLISSVVVVRVNGSASLDLQHDFTIACTAAHIRFKTLMFAYRTATGSAPACLHSLLRICIPARNVQVSEVSWYHHREAQITFQNIFVHRSWLVEWFS